MDGHPEGKGTHCLYDRFGNLRIKYIGSLKNDKYFGKGTLYFYDRNGKITDTQNGWFDGDFLGEN